MLMANEMRAFRIMIGITLLAILLLAGGVGAIPIEEWNKTYGGTGNSGVRSVHQTSDGGYILAGYRFSSGAGYDALLIKTDANGNEQWIKTFGGTGEERAESVQQTSDGGYILAGYVLLSPNGYDALVIKTDANGNQQWNKTFGGKGADEARSVQQTKDGGYIVAGKYSLILDSGYPGDGWLIKIDADGNQQWSKIFGRAITSCTVNMPGETVDVNASDEFSSVQQTSDGSYILAGRTETNNQPECTGFVDNAWLMKTDANGNEQWNKPLDGPIMASSVQQTLDGGYVLVSYSPDKNEPSGVASRSDAWLIKTGANGNVQWKKTFGGTKSDVAYSVMQTKDTGYILAGYTESYGAGNDAWLIKTDSNGNEQWNKTFGGAKQERAFTVEQTSDAGYILAGYNVSSTGFTDAWLIKVRGEPSETIIAPTANPTEKAEITKVPTIIPTEKNEPTQFPTAVPTAKAAGFEVFLALVTLSAIYIFMHKKR
jgi:hypothetical protein